MRQALVALLLVLVPVAAVGKEDGTDRARQLFAHAETLYTLQKWRDALGEYEKAYEVKPLPGFLFNIAQCHRQLGEPAAAAHFYRAYLERTPRAPNRELVKGFIAEMDTRAQADLSAKSDAPPPELTPPTVTRPENLHLQHDPQPPLSALNAPPPSLLPQASDEPPREEVPLTHRWWVWATVGGVAVAGAAVLVAVLAGGGSAPPMGTLSTLDAR